MKSNKCQNCGKAFLTEDFTYFHSFRVCVRCRDILMSEESTSSESLQAQLASLQLAADIKDAVISQQVEDIYVLKEEVKNSGKDFLIRALEDKVRNLQIELAILNDTIAQQAEIIPTLEDKVKSMEPIHFKLYYRITPNCIGEKDTPFYMTPKELNASEYNLFECTAKVVIEQVYLTAEAYLTLKGE